MKLSVFYEHILEAAVQSSRSVEEICDLVVSYGISAVEIENKRLMDKEENAASILRNAGLSISCIYGFFDLSHQGDIKEGLSMVELAKEVHAKKIMIIPGFLKGTDRLPFLKKKKIDRMILALNAISEYAKKNDIILVLEDFDDKAAPYCNAKGLLYFMENVKDLGCAFDTGNFLYSGEDALEVLPLFLPKIAHVHCKDRKEMSSCAVGSGCIKMKEIVEEILKSGYDDYFAIEHFGSPDQLKDMESSAKWLQEI